jgi:hypothetical protein
LRPPPAAAAPAASHTAIALPAAPCCICCSGSYSDPPPPAAAHLLLHLVSLQLLLLLLLLHLLLPLLHLLLLLLQVEREVVSAVSDLIKEPSVRSIIITGKGKAFAAGADIKEMAQLTQEKVGEIKLRHCVFHITKANYLFSGIRLLAIPLTSTHDAYSADEFATGL